jgi:hypothetical protein
MEWHWLPFALIGAILWIIQNVRNQQPPATPATRGSVVVPQPTRRSAPPAPKANRREGSREPARARPARRPQPSVVVSPAPPIAPRLAEPQPVMMARGTPVSMFDAATVLMPDLTRAGVSPGRKATLLLKQPDSAAVAFVLREILDEPLCKRGRGRSR